MGIMAMLMKAPAVAGGNYDATVLAETSLTHFYKMNEAAGAGTALDSKGSVNGANSGVTSGSTALLSDGETSYLGSGTAAVAFTSVLTPSSGAYSVECWVKGAQTNTSLWQMGADWTVNGYALLLDSNGFYRLITNATGLSGSLGPGGTAQHVVVTNDGTNTLVYVNGSVSVTATASYVSPTGSSRLFTELTLNHHYTGNISKFATYNAALTSTQVSSHYAAR